jgi:hypothetical protein
MTRATALRRSIAIIAVALAASTTAGPASARTSDPDSRASLVHQRAPGIPHAKAPAAARNSIDWGYIAIGSSAVALMLTGVCAAVTTGRRHAQRDNARRKPIAPRDRQTTGGRST